jgi:cytochrome c7-like protein
MPQVFSKGSNSVARVTIIGLVVGFFGFWGVVYAVYLSPYTTVENVPRAQPVPFSHQHHVSGLGLDCRYCHTSVEKSSFAGLPATHICMSCHSQVWTDAPMLAPVRNSLATNRPLQWNRVNQLPDFVFFNHSVHVRKGIGCSTCHGRVDQMPLTWKSHSLYMRWCLDCHEAPQKQLRPQSEIYNMAWTPPPDQLEQARKLAVEYHLSKERLSQLKDCSMCHR